MSARTGFLGLGANVGDRRGHLQAAVDALRDRGIEVQASSAVYETEPVGEVTDQPDFLNACVKVRTALGAEQLLAACKDVEREVGRASGGRRHGPRAIDVDVLLLGEEEHSAPALRIPHPELERRRFVLVPLLELDPDLRLPGGAAAADALELLPAGQRVRRWGPPLAL